MTCRREPKWDDEFIKAWCEFSGLIYDTDDGDFEFNNMARDGLKLISDVVARGYPLDSDTTWCRRWTKRIGNRRK